MLFIFRKLRQGLFKEVNVSRYIGYALGEIILIVVGILLALQLNNWNDARKEQTTIKQYARSLIQDLEQDLLMIGDIETQLADIISRIELLGEYVRDKDLDDLSNLHLFTYTLNKPHRPYIWNRATIDELKGSGISGYIQNPELAEMISEYDAFTQHLDVDYVNDKAQFEKCTALAAQIVNYNYPNFYALREKLLPLNNDRDYDFFETAEFKEAEAYPLSLLTNDINLIHEAVNNYNILVVYLRIRTDAEIPKLKDDIEALIQLLNQTYFK